jgi:hypothetical protein
VWHFTTNRVALTLALLPAVWAVTFVAVWCNVALVYAANEILDGTHPSVKGSLAGSWALRGIIARWSVVSVVVGVVLSQLRRFGAVGRVFEVPGDATWAIATWMVVPVLAFENIGPIDAVRRSGSLLAHSFGKLVRGQLRISARYFGWMFLCMFVGVFGIFLWPVSSVLCVAVVAGGVLGMMFFIAYASAVSYFVRSVVYRFCTGAPLPNLGFDVGTTFAMAGGGTASPFTTASPFSPSRGTGAVGSVVSAPAPGAPVTPVSVGWYPINGDSARQSYFDGTAWSGAYRYNGTAWVPEA